LLNKSNSDECATAGDDIKEQCNEEKRIYEDLEFRIVSIEGVCVYLSLDSC
jgi:hypothetical protein